MKPACLELPRLDHRHHAGVRVALFIADALDAFAMAVSPLPLVRSQA